MKSARASGSRWICWWEMTGCRQPCGWHRKKTETSLLRRIRCRGLGEKRRKKNESQDQNVFGFEWSAGVERGSGRSPETRPGWAATLWSPDGVDGLCRHAWRKSGEGRAILGHGYVGDYVDAAGWIGVAPDVAGLDVSGQPGKVAARGHFYRLWASDGVRRGEEDGDDFRSGGQRTHHAGRRAKGGAQDGPTYPRRKRRGCGVGSGV